MPRDDLSWPGADVLPDAVQLSSEQDPSGNFFPASASDVGFVNYNGGNGGNYQLQANSPYKNAGTDGKDLGADISAIQAVIAGVF